MHEFSIIDSLLIQLRELIAEHGLREISAVEIEAGELRQVIPEIMEFAFAQSVRGTELEGARITIIPIEARARCRRCDHTFRPALTDFSCPQCQVAAAEVLAGDQIILKNITAPKEARQDMPS